MSDKAEDLYRLTASLNNEAYGKNTFAADVANNEALGNNVLKEELGVYEDGGVPLLADDLDQRTRDRLISHTRQDVASTFAHAKSAFKAAHEAREISLSTRRLARLSLFLLIVLVLQGFIMLSAST